MELLSSIKESLGYTVANITVGRLTIAILIIFVFLLIRQIFSKIIIKTMKKLANKTKTTLDDDLIETAAPPIKFFIASLGFYFSLLYLNLGKTYNIVASKIFVSIIIFVISWTFYRAENILSIALEKFFKKKNYEVALSFIPFFNRFIKFTIIAFSTILIIQAWGYNIGALITGLGIGGLAVALAAKDTLANMFGSIMILFDRPFKIGDWIKTSSTEGIVEDIGFRSTKVRTFENSLVSVPNSQIANEPIENFSLRNRRRIKFTIGLTYSTPVEKVEEAVEKIRNMLIDHSDIYKGTLLVYFTEFADSSLNIFIYCFTNTAVWRDYLNIRQDVNLKIMSIMESLKIDFAFPSLSVYMENDEQNRD
jgi:MscS family membrane protein